MFLCALAAVFIAAELNGSQRRSLPLKALPHSNRQICFLGEVKWLNSVIYSLFMELGDENLEESFDFVDIF